MPAAAARWAWGRPQYCSVTLMASGQGVAESLQPSSSFKHVVMNPARSRAQERKPQFGMKQQSGVTCSGIRATEGSMRVEVLKEVSSPVEPSLQAAMETIGVYMGIYALDTSMSLYIYICIHTCTSIHPSIHPSIRPSVHPSIRPSVRPSMQTDRQPDRPHTHTHPCMHTYIHTLRSAFVQYHASTVNLSMHPVNIHRHRACKRQLGQEYASLPHAGP